ncbi:MAG: glycosyltransferase family 2 protein [Fibrobacter sp.]|nr:glycosyltransferase family 2 protein [Fibrobacter sp.]
MPQEQPLISVIVPVYKVEEYLDQCVESIVNQTYRNLEIILVDDGSPDKCPEMCDAWAKKDARIKVVHKENGGLGDARNAGIAVAKGDYFGFIDSDDWCEPDMFQEMLGACLEYNAQISVCNALIDWENGWAQERTVFSDMRTFWESPEILKNFFNGRLTAWACNKLYRKELVEYLHYPKQPFEDIPIARNVLTRTEKLAFSGKDSYHYRQRLGSIVNANINASQFVLIEELEKNVEAAKVFSLEKVAIARLAISSYNFLIKIETAGKCTLGDKIPQLLEHVRAYKFNPLKDRTVRGKDRIFQYCIACGFPYKVVLLVRRMFQKIYWLLDMKRVNKKK